MAESSLSLDARETYALAELVNLGVSRAAGALRQLAGGQVSVTVPAVSLISHAQAIEALSQTGQGPFAAVIQRFSGDFTGSALLVVPQARLHTLTRVVLAESAGPDDIGGMEDEVMAETGNIILNAYLGTIANMLQRTLNVALPEVLAGDGPAIFGHCAPAGGGDLVISQSIDFTLKARNVSGHLAMILDIPSLKAFKALLAEFGARAGVAGVTFNSA